ncbi:hypothetical protein LAZ29_01820 [Cereibacter sphaeroides]|nr:hypothetical protein [Cereibacter sphaeroides]
MLRKQVYKRVLKTLAPVRNRRVTRKDMEYLLLRTEGGDVRLLVEKDDLRKIQNWRSLALRRRRMKAAQAQADREMSDQPATRLLPGPDAYRPDARARAVLRGIEISEQDLASAGGAFDLAEVQRLMRGVSRQAVDKRVQDGSLLAVPGPSNRKVYPTVQFTRDGTLVPGLKEVRNALGHESPWSMLNFLVNPHDALGGRKPIDLLKDGKTHLVIQAAESEGQQGA